jgi:hypothetical protein
MVGSLEGEVAMDLLPFILPAALFLVLQWLWVRPSWLRMPEGGAHEAGAHEAGAHEAGASADPPPADGDPFALPFIRQRLSALAAELERLEHDEGVFAKAFRTRVAQCAYDALIADEARLATATLEVEYIFSADPLREEIDV